MEEKKKSVFLTLNAINVNDHTEKKKTGESRELTYLSWAWAWGELMKVYPDATYEVTKYGDMQQPYYYDPNLGYMCHTTMTIEGVTREMWLPVMNGANKAMKTQPYTYISWNNYKKAYEDKTVEAATMFDINKTIMRCLVKNIGMFGLGLYIYAGEDLPENEQEQKQEQSQQEKQAQQTAVAYTGAQLEQALAELKNCTCRDDINLLWQKWAEDCPAMLAKGTEFYNAVAAKNRGLAS